MTPIAITKIWLGESLVRRVNRPTVDATKDHRGKLQWLVRERDGLRFSHGQR